HQLTSFALEARVHRLHDGSAWRPATLRSSGEEMNRPARPSIRSAWLHTPCAPPSPSHRTYGFSTDISPDNACLRIPTGKSERRMSLPAAGVPDPLRRLLARERAGQIVASKP